MPDEKLADILSVHRIPDKFVQFRVAYVRIDRLLDQIVRVPMPILEHVREPFLHYRVLLALDRDRHGFPPKRKNRLMEKGPIVVRHNVALLAHVHESASNIDLLREQLLKVLFTDYTRLLEVSFEVLRDDWAPNIRLTVAFIVLLDQLSIGQSLLLRHFFQRFYPISALFLNDELVYKIRRWPSVENSG